jgi:hypothetical protein
MATQTRERTSTTTTEENNKNRSFHVLNPQGNWNQQNPMATSTPATNIPIFRDRSVRFLGAFPDNSTRGTPLRSRSLDTGGRENNPRGGHRPLIRRESFSEMIEIVSQRNSDHSR